MMSWIYFLISLLIAILVHEFGHLFVALLCGVKVEAFSVGFGKPLYKRKIKGIEFRLTPFLLGGYTKLAGEFDKKVKNGFLTQRYSKKILIALAGVTMNFIVAIICYLIHYKSIYIGIMVDTNIFLAVLKGDYLTMIEVITVFCSNAFLLQLSLINFFCALFNFLPFPALDGALLWILLLEKKIKNFGKFFKNICQWGFVILMILQFILIYYIYTRR